jgi:hypothetical protein
MILAATNPTSKPAAVSLIPTRDGFTVVTTAGPIGHILGSAHDKDVEASAYLAPVNGNGRELVGTFGDIGAAVQFITETAAHEAWQQAHAEKRHALGYDEIVSDDSALDILGLL